MQGFSVSHHVVIMKASKIMPKSSTKSEYAKYAAMRCLFDSHNLVYHLGTPLSQKPQMLAHADSVGFVATIHRFLYGPSHDPKFILNMDQTHMFYSIHEKRILNKKDAQTVNVRTS